MSFHTFIYKIDKVSKNDYKIHTFYFSKKHRKDYKLHDQKRFFFQNRHIIILKLISCSFKINLFRKNSKFAKRGHFQIAGKCFFL